MAEYIEREAAIDAIMKVYVRTAGYKARERVFEAKEAVHRLPVADVAPVVHGQWISWEEADNFTPSPHRHECSVCHDAAQVLVNNIELLSDYCPNCGARMDGDAE